MLNLLSPTQINLILSKKYGSKDIKKIEKATCFIGEGCPRSSTELYYNIFNSINLANKGQYTESDMAFVSVNGNRAMSLSLTQLMKNEINLLKKSNGKLIADSLYNLSRPYNIGERTLRDFLFNSGWKIYESSSDYVIWF
jgi:hypothetical protein